MLRRQILVTLLAVLTVAALPAVAAAHTAKPAIKADEAGYFGNGLSTNRIDVFVYSRSQPRAGTRVTVCYKGVCEQARGHNTKQLAWYEASFSTPTLPMWAPIPFSAVASNSVGQTRARVTKELLCIHNDGTVPDPQGDPTV